MSNMKLLGVAVLLLVAAVASASDKLSEPVGFFVDPVVSSDDTPTGSHAKFIRDGKEYDATVGGEVFVGDVVMTDSTGDIQIAFMDSSAIRLFASTEFRVGSETVVPANSGSGGASVLPKAQPTLTVSYGHAAFKASPLAVDSEATDASVASRGKPFSIGIQNLVNLGTGKAKISASTLAQFDIIVTPDANGTTFTSNIAVLKGSATLVPVNSNKVTMSFLTTLLLTINTPVAGVGASQTTVNSGNLTATQINALAANSVSDTSVVVTKKGVTINTAIKSADGTISLGSVTDVNGVLSKDTWTTEDAANKIVATWKESTTSISLVRVFQGFTLKASIKKPIDTGKGTLVGPTKISYSGTTTIDPVTGTITFTTTKAGKDGSTAVYTYNPVFGNGPTSTLITVTKAGVASETIVSYSSNTGVQTTTTQTGTFVGGKFVGSGSPTVTNTTIGTQPIAGTTPDGHALDPNLPPASQ